MGTPTSAKHWKETKYIDVRNHFRSYYDAEAKTFDFDKWITALYYGRHELSYEEGLLFQIIIDALGRGAVTLDMKLDEFMFRVFEQCEFDIVVQDVKTHGAKEDVPDGIGPWTLVALNLTFLAVFIAGILIGVLL